MRETLKPLALSRAKTTLPALPESPLPGMETPNVMLPPPSSTGVSTPLPPPPPPALEVSIDTDDRTLSDGSGAMPSAKSVRSTRSLPHVDSMDYLKQRGYTMERGTASNSSQAEILVEKRSSVAETAAMFGEMARTHSKTQMIIAGGSVPSSRSPKDSKPSFTSASAPASPVAPPMTALETE